MNKFKYKDILVTYDDENHWEYPPSFDWEAAFRKFDAVEDKLRSVVNVSCSESREAIQDASYHGTITIDDNSESSAFIRFSNFGNMVSILNPENISPENMNQVLELIKGFDYLYVPVSELNCQYDGKLKKFEGTWFNRFFDYM